MKSFVKRLVSVSTLKTSKPPRSATKINFFKGNISYHREISQRKYSSSTADEEVEKRISQLFNEHQQKGEDLKKEVNQIIFPTVSQITAAWFKEVEECLKINNPALAMHMNSSFFDKMVLLIWEYQHSGKAYQLTTPLELQMLKETNEAYRIQQLKQGVEVMTPEDMLETLQDSHVSSTQSEADRQAYVLSYATLLALFLHDKDFDSAITSAQALCNYLDTYVESKNPAARKVDYDKRDSQSRDSTSTNTTKETPPDSKNKKNLSEQFEAVFASGHESFIDQEFEKQFVGLHSVRDQLKTLMHRISMNLLRRQRGLITEEQLDNMAQSNLHVAFLGNPGTGKTSVARLYAGLLHKMGILERPRFVELHREHLVGAHIGSTENIMKELFKSHSGSVLLVDEAYRLVSANTRFRAFGGGGYDSHDFGIIALEAMMAEMTKKYEKPERDRIIFIFAGYPEPMKDFLAYNPGMKRRIGFVIQFPDYSVTELQQIFIKKATSFSFKVDNQVQQELAFFLLENFSQGQISEVNGGLPERLFELSIDTQSQRLRKMMNDSFTHHHFTNDELMTITMDDIKQASSILKSQYASMQQNV